MLNNVDFYRSPFGYSGIGSDIRWCKRWSGGKFCMYCKHYAEFSEWSNNWHWYYLLSWEDPYYGWWGWEEYSHFKVRNFYNIYYKNNMPGRQNILKPNRYRTVGITENDLKSLLRRGCKKKRKCKCVSVSQRGSWYCPECHYLITRAAKHRKVPFHDLTITDRTELKEEILILLLSGTL